jgi:hypothetical protein
MPAAPGMLACITFLVGTLLRCSEIALGTNVYHSKLLSSLKSLLLVSVVLVLQACRSSAPVLDSINTIGPLNKQGWQTPVWDGPSTTQALAGYTEFRGRFALDFQGEKLELDIDNPCGDILIKDSNKAGWLGATVIGQQAPNTAMPTLRYRRHQRTWFIKLSCPDRTASARSRMDLNVFVPALLRAHFRTSDGNMRALGLKVPASIETQSGRLMLGNNQNTRIRSLSGDVFLSVSSAALTIEIQSDTGQIELSIPDKNVLIQANSTTINSQLKTSVIKTEIADAKVRLKTEKGAITLLPALINE